MLLRHVSKYRLLTCSKPFTRHLSLEAVDLDVNTRINALVYVAKEVPQTSQDLPLHNVSVAIKDNICTSDMPTTCASNILAKFKSPFDATVVALLREAGAFIVGKANCDEFGMGSLNLWSIHGPALNPRQPSHVEPKLKAAGGSSGGSAAAVAAGLCDVGLGTDTGGSVRLPASYCGVVGLKPSYGIISRWGVISYADSLDCVGLLGKDIESVRKVFHALAQYDRRDPTSARPETRQQASTFHQSLVQQLHSNDQLHKLRIGIPQEYFPAELNSSILGPFKDLIASLKSRGAKILPVSLPSTRYALSAYYVIASAEASSNLARYDGIEYGLRVDPEPGSQFAKTSEVYARTRSQGFGHEVQRRILLGTYALTADAFDNYFLQAQRVRKLIRADFDQVFRAPNALISNPKATSPEGVDVLLHPSAIQPAPELIQDPQDKSYRLKESNDTLDAYVQDVLTVPASLAGLPAMNVPAGAGGDGWPVGVSIVGQWGCDEMVLEVGKHVERIVEETQLR